MRRSIRWRLQAWYALVLLATVGGFAFILYSEARSSRYQEVDAALEAAAKDLDSHLRQIPPHVLTGQWPPDRMPPMFGPPPPEMQRTQQLLLTLDLPYEQRRAGGYFGVWRGDGHLLKSANLPEGIASPALSPLPTPRPRIVSRGEYREAVMHGPHMTGIVVGRSITAEDAALRRFAWRLVLAGGGALVIGLAGGWFVSTRIFRPIAAISATASRISADNLSERINEERVDRELEELAQVLNRMFARLESAFARQAQFTADASHELRTPLAVIRSHAELALARPREAEEYCAALKTCASAAGRMGLLVDGLLTLARADAGRLELRREPVELGALVEEAVDQFRPLAMKMKINLTAKLGPAMVRGDPLRLDQVVTNLLSNALQYNRTGGTVRVTLKTRERHATLTIVDTGIGIRREDRPLIFERFFRADKARSRANGGSGLGLAICKGIVEAHGGEIGFDSEPNVGTRFWVRLPLTTRM